MAMAEEAAVKRRKLRGGPVTRAKILNVAWELFTAQGYQTTSVRDIAEALGITDAALYYYFKGKRELLQEVLAAWGCGPRCACERRAQLS